MSIGRITAVVVAAAVVIAGCGGEDFGPRWVDGDEFSEQRVTDAETVAEGDDWRFDVGFGAERRLCLQLVFAEQAFGCVPVNPEGFGFSATMRIDDRRLIWRPRTPVDDTVTDHFVVWSSESPDGRRIEPVTHGRIESLLWIMEPGETPWGYQVIAADGTLLSDTSVVGLSGA